MPDHPSDATPSSSRARIEVLGLAEAARRRPELFFGASWDDPWLPTLVVRGVVLDLVSGAPRDGRLVVRLTITGDHEVHLELSAARPGQRAGRRNANPAAIPVRYSLTAAASGLAETRDVKVGPRFLALRLRFDPTRFATGSALSRNPSAYTDASGVGPWLTPQMLDAVTVEDRRAPGQA